MQQLPAARSVFLLLIPESVLVTVCLVQQPSSIDPSPPFIGPQQLPLHSEVRRPQKLLCGGGGGGWHGRPAKEGGGGFPEMGFRAGPFVLCKDGCCHQRHRNTNFGPEWSAIWGARSPLDRRN